MCTHRLVHIPYSPFDLVLAQNVCHHEMRERQLFRSWSVTKCRQMHHYIVFCTRGGVNMAAGCRMACTGLNLFPRNFGPAATLARSLAALPAPLQLAMAESSAGLLAPTASECAPPRGQRTLFDTGFKRHTAGAKAAPLPPCARHRTASVKQQLLSRKLWWRGSAQRAVGPNLVQSTR
jgi:hypothetical protein